MWVRFTPLEFTKDLNTGRLTIFFVLVRVWRVYYLTGYLVGCVSHSEDSYMLAASSVRR